MAYHLWWIALNPYGSCRDILRARDSSSAKGSKNSRGPSPALEKEDFDLVSRDLHVSDGGDWRRAEAKGWLGKPSPSAQIDLMCAVGPSEDARGKSREGGQLSAEPFKAKISWHAWERGLLTASKLRRVRREANSAAVRRRYPSPSVRFDYER